MLFLLVGAMLAIIGIVLLAAPPIWRGRLSGGKPRAVATAATTVAGVGVQAKVTFAFESVVAGRLPVYYGRQLVAYVDAPEDLPDARFVERDGRLAGMLNVWEDSAEQIAA